MGAAPHPIHETLYMGLRPKPHSRTFLPKSPRDPKKPDWIGFGLSNRDREQGCRRQPCFFVWKSISNFVVSLPNLSKKDVKGLLSRKQPRTGGFNLSKSGKRFKLYCQLTEPK